MSTIIVQLGDGGRRISINTDNITSYLKSKYGRRDRSISYGDTIIYLKRYHDINIMNYEHSNVWIRSIMRSYNSNK